MKVRSSVYATSLSVAEVRRALGNAVGKARVSDLPPNSLEEPADVRVAVEHRPHPFASTGSIELRVRDRGSFREVEISAKGTTFAEGTAQGFAGETGDYRPLGAGKKLAARIVDGLRAADPRLKQTS